MCRSAEPAQAKKKKAKKPKKKKKKKKKRVYEVVRMCPPGLVQFCFEVNGRTVVAQNIPRRPLELSDHVKILRMAAPRDNQ